MSVCQSVGLSVGPSVGPSVADHSEHATYGDRPCFFSESEKQGKVTLYRPGGLSVARQIVDDSI